jgi:hypothetical protein
MPMAGYLNHRHGINDFFIALGREGRDSSYIGLSRWMNSAESRVCLPAIGLDIRPDAYGEFTKTESDKISFFFEYDRGTEALRKVTDKLYRYLTLGGCGQSRNQYYGRRFPKVLIMTTTGGRARNVKEHFESFLERKNELALLAGYHFLVSWDDEKHRCRLTGKIWYRCGHPQGMVSMLD